MQSMEENLPPYFKKSSEDNCFHDFKIESQYSRKKSMHFIKISIKNSFDKISYIKKHSCTLKKLCGLPNL